MSVYDLMDEVIDFDLLYFNRFLSNLLATVGFLDSADWPTKFDCLLF